MDISEIWDEATSEVDTLAPPRDRIAYGVDHRRRRHRILAVVVGLLVGLAPVAAAIYVLTMRAGSETTPAVVPTVDVQVQSFANPFQRDRLADIEFAGGIVWAWGTDSDEDGTLVGYRAGDEVTRLHVPLPVWLEDGGGIAGQGERLWVGGGSDGNLEAEGALIAEIDMTTVRVSKISSMPGEAVTDIAADDGLLWVSTRQQDGTGLISMVSPKNLAPLEEWAVDGPVRRLMVVPGGVVAEVWQFDANQVFEGSNLIRITGSDGALETLGEDIAPVHYDPLEDELWGLTPVDTGGLALSRFTSSNREGVTIPPPVGMTFASIAPVFSGGQAWVGLESSDPSIARIGLLDLGTGDILASARLDETSGVRALTGDGDVVWVAGYDGRLVQVSSG